MFLATAHLDHDPGNNLPANLKAFCQRCHMLHDAREHSRERLQQAEQIAVAVNLDMRQFWTPETVFLSRLSKAQIAEVMHEAGCSNDAIKAIGKAPKAEAVALAETALRGKSWLCAPLRAPHDDEADTADAVAIAAE